MTAQTAAPPDHGSRARYCRGCRCGGCTEANRRGHAHRERMIVYGRWQPFADASRAREHVQALSAAGIGWRRAAELAGVSETSVSKLLYGGPGGRPPTRRLRTETARKLLAVQPSLEALGARAHVDAAGAGGCGSFAGAARRAARDLDIEFRADHDPGAADSRDGPRGPRLV